VACNTSNQSALARFSPHHGVVCSVPSTLHPQPSTLNPIPSTPHPQPYTLNPTPSTLHTPRFLPLTAGLRSECRTSLSRATSSVFTGGGCSAESHSKPTQRLYGFGCEFNVYGFRCGFNTYTFRSVFDARSSLRRHLNHQPHKSRPTPWSTTL